MVAHLQCLERMAVDKIAGGLNKTLESFRPGRHSCGARFNARGPPRRKRASWFYSRVRTRHIQSPILHLIHGARSQDGGQGYERQSLIASLEGRIEKPAQDSLEKRQAILSGR